MRIASRTIGEGDPFVIAEIGVNHDGDPDRALLLCDHAADAGADAIKLQYFEAERLMSTHARLAAYQASAGETDPVAMLQRLELSIEQMAPVVERAHERGLAAIVTVFSVELVEPSLALRWDAFKTASPDLVHTPLLRALTATGLPLIVSTGAAGIDDVERARQAVDPSRTAFLHCVSSYPTPPEDANVSACAALADLVEPCPAGYSDHTERSDTGFVARHAGGAVILEKHLTDDRSRRGPDHRASLEPDGFAEYVRWTKQHADDWRSTEGVAVELAGHGKKRPATIEKDVRSASRQSIVAKRALQPGHVIGERDLTFKRPGTGLEPWQLDRVVGATLVRAVDADQAVTLDDLAAKIPA